MHTVTSLLTGAKFRRRARLIVAHSLQSLLIPLLNPIVSLLVVRLASASLWGEFVGVLIVVQLGMHVIAWGNKEYLLREFSFNPTRIARAWQASLMTRLGLAAVFFLIVGLIGLPPHRLLPVIAWSLGLTLYQSFDVLVLYKKDFVFAVLAEVGGLGFMALSIAWWGSQIDLDRLIILFGAATWLKAAALLTRYRRQTLVGASGRPALSGRFDLRYFCLALPFFLLGFSGLLQSRIDLYTANTFLPRSELGQYQVFMTFMIYLQSISNFILAPFAKNVYRMSYHAIFGISTRLLILGIAVLLPGSTAVYTVLHAYYGFDVPATAFVAGSLFVLPIYFYLPIIYALYKAGSQSVVVKINTLGIVVNLLLSVLLLPRVGMVGAVTGAAVAQWCMFVAYWVQSRSLREGYALALPELPRAT